MGGVAKQLLWTVLKLSYISGAMKTKFLKNTSLCALCCLSFVVYAQGRNDSKNLKPTAPRALLLKQLQTPAIGPADEIQGFTELADGVMVLPSYTSNRGGELKLSFIDASHNFSNQSLYLEGVGLRTRKVVPLRDGNVFVLIDNRISDHEIRSKGYILKPTSLVFKSFPLEQFGVDAFEDPQGNLLIHQVQGAGDMKDDYLVRYSQTGRILGTVKLPRGITKLIQAKDGSFFSVIAPADNAPQSLMLMNSDGSERSVINGAKAYIDPQALSDGTIGVVTTNSGLTVEVVKYSTSGIIQESFQYHLREPIENFRSENRFRILDHGTLISNGASVVAYVAGKRDPVTLYAHNDKRGLPTPVILADGTTLLGYQNDNRSQFTLRNIDGSEYMKFVTQMDKVDYRGPDQFKVAKDGALWFTGLVDGKRVFELRKIIEAPKAALK